jgi:hypothetical protein
MRVLMDVVIDDVNRIPEPEGPEMADPTNPLGCETLMFR